MYSIVQNFIRFFKQSIMHIFKIKTGRWPQNILSHGISSEIAYNSKGNILRKSDFSKRNSVRMNGRPT